MATIAQEKRFCYIETMSVFELKRLMLHRAFIYSALPPSSAFPGSAGQAGALPFPPLETEGEEELAVFAAEGLVLMDRDDGPRMQAYPLPPALFYGRAAAGAPAGRPGSQNSGSTADAAPESSGLQTWTLEPGAYLLLQWRPENAAEFREGVEYFARQAWWEDEKAEGPYFIRRLREDGKTATQIWRRRQLTRP